MSNGRKLGSRAEQEKDARKMGVLGRWASEGGGGKEKSETKLDDSSYTSLTRAAPVPERPPVI